LENVAKFRYMGMTVTKQNYPQKYLKLINPLNAKLNPICHPLALLEAHHILHVSRIRVKFKKCWQN